jgi:hypothetical protein
VDEFYNEVVDPIRKNYSAQKLEITPLRV